MPGESESEVQIEPRFDVRIAPRRNGATPTVMRGQSAPQVRRGIDLMYAAWNRQTPERYLEVGFLAAVVLGGRFEGEDDHFVVTVTRVA